MDDITINDVKDNPEAVIEAVARALGIPPEEISIDDLHETPSGILVKVRSPKDTEIPKDFAEKAQEELRKKPGFSDVNIAEPGIFFFLIFWFFVQVHHLIN